MFTHKTFQWYLYPLAIRKGIRKIVILKKHAETLRSILIPLILQPPRITRHSKTLNDNNDNIFSNIISHEVIYGNITTPILDKCAPLKRINQKSITVKNSLLKRFENVKDLQTKETFHIQYKD